MIEIGAMKILNEIKQFVSPLDVPVAISLPYVILYRLLCVPITSPQRIYLRMLPTIQRNVCVVY